MEELKRQTKEKLKIQKSEESQSEESSMLDVILEQLMDPVAGSQSQGRSVEGAVLMHVDDLLIFGTKKFRTWFITKLENGLQGWEHVRK